MEFHRYAHISPQGDSQTPVSASKTPTLNHCQFCDDTNPQSLYFYFVFPNATNSSGGGARAQPNHRCSRTEGKRLFSPSSFFLLTHSAECLSVCVAANDAFTRWSPSPVVSIKK